MSKDHHYPAILRTTESLLTKDNLDRFKRYATDETGLNPGSGVYLNRGELEEIVSPKAEIGDIVYIDGGFDLFHPGHIEILKIVQQEATKLEPKLLLVFMMMLRSINTRAKLPNNESFGKIVMCFAMQIC